jgi:phosphatidylglycerophosphate synthase
MVGKYKELRLIAYPSHKREYGNKLLYSILCRSVSTRLAVFLKKLNVSPNQISMVSILSGCIGIYCLFIGQYLTGAILSANSKFLDCIDGEVARLTGTFSKAGGWLEELNSNLQYLFLFPSIGFALYKQGVMGLIWVFFAMIAAGCFVAVRTTYNRTPPMESSGSLLKNIILCQFKHSNELRQKNRLGAFLYYLRYNLIAQNGIMYPALILICVVNPNWLSAYVKYFVFGFSIFFIGTFLGVLIGSRSYYVE